MYNECSIREEDIGSREERKKLWKNGVYGVLVEFHIFFYSISYHSTLVGLTLLKLLLKTLKALNFHKRKICERNIESLKIFYLWKWKFQNKLIVWQTCVEVVKEYNSKRIKEMNIVKFKYNHSKAWVKTTSVWAL